MRVAIIRKKYTFHGGAEGFSQGFIDLLIREGHEVHVHAIQWDAGTSDNRIRFHHVPAFTFNSLLRDLTFALYVKQQVQGGQYDIIQSHDKTLYQDIYRAGDGCHSEWLRQRRLRTGLAGRLSMLLNPYHWLILSLERTIYERHRYRKIIAISELVKRNILEHYRVREEDIAVIYNPVDLEKYHPANRQMYRQNIRAQYGLSDRDFVVLFVGSGFERKGVKYLLEAAELLREKVTVMVVGKGKEAPFRKMRRKQNVIFCGPQQQVERYYAAADVFVFPSIYEPFGNVHLEALASGLPVITTANSGAAEIIEEGRSGFVVARPEDAAAIADGLRKLMNRDTLQAMSAAARKTAGQFTFDHYAGTIRRLYADILEEKKLQPGSAG